jgi:hypothetical protein
MKRRSPDADTRTVVFLDRTYLVYVLYRFLAVAQ